MVKQLSRAKLFIGIAIVIATAAGLIIFTRNHQKHLKAARLLR